MTDGLQPPIESAEPADSGELLSPEGERPAVGVSRSYYRNLAIGAVVLLVVCGGFILLTTRDDANSSASATDDSEYDMDDSVITTEAPDPVDVCVDELSEWLPFVTGAGSPIDAGAEWGMQSEEYQIIMGAWQIFNQNLYQVGNDQASAKAYQAISNGCHNMTHEYIPGHYPPG